MPVQIRMTVRPTDSVINWNVDVIDFVSGAKKGSFRHSTWKAKLIPSEDLARTQPGFKPKLNPRGEARRTVVNLCDGVVQARVKVPWDDLETKLHTNAKVQTDHELYIEADTNLTYGMVLQTMAIAKKAGVTKLLMMSDPIDTSKPVAPHPQ